MAWLVINVFRMNKYIQQKAKAMKSIYSLALILSLSLTCTISQAQSLEGIQDMAADQASALDLVADQTSVPGFNHGSGYLIAGCCDQ